MGCRGGRTWGKPKEQAQGRQFGQRRAGGHARFPQAQKQHAKASKEKRSSVLSLSPFSLATPAPAHHWVRPHCPGASGHGYAALFSSGAASLSASTSRRHIPEHLREVKRCSGSWRLLLSLQQTHNTRCCNGWAALKASACPHWSGAGRFPGAGLMQRQLQSTAISGVNTLAFPQLPMLLGRLNSCLGLAGAGLQPKARATSLPALRLSISFAFPKVAVRIPSLQHPPATQYLSSASSKVSLCLPKHPALCFVARSPSLLSGSPAWPRAAAGVPGHRNTDHRW